MQFFEESIKNDQILWYNKSLHNALNKWKLKTQDFGFVFFVNKNLLISKMTMNYESHKLWPTKTTFLFYNIMTVKHNFHATLTDPWLRMIIWRLRVISHSQLQEYLFVWNFFWERKVISNKWFFQKSGAQIKFMGENDVRIWKDRPGIKNWFVKNFYTGKLKIN